MTDSVKKTIEELVTVLRMREEDVASMKRTVNMLCEHAGLPKRYSETAIVGDSSSFSDIRTDQFHGRPLATVVTEYMEMRRAANVSPAKAVEIYDGVKRGGFVFESKSASNAKRVLRISLSKNPKFYRLPGGEYGLRKWYPAAKTPKVDEAPKNVPEDDGDEFPDNEGDGFPDDADDGAEG